MKLHRTCAAYAIPQVSCTRWRTRLEASCGTQPIFPSSFEKCHIIAHFSTIACMDLPDVSTRVWFTTLPPLGTWSCFAPTTMPTNRGDTVAQVPIRIPSKSPTTGAPTPRPHGSRSRRRSHHRPHRVILHTADHNVLDHHFQDNAPPHRIQKVAEHPHHIAADLQPVVQNHLADITPRTLLAAVERLPGAPLSWPPHHAAWILGLFLHQMLMTPGVTGRTTNLMPIKLTTDDLVLHQVLFCKYFSSCTLGLGFLQGCHWGQWCIRSRSRRTLLDRYLRTRRHWHWRNEGSSSWPRAGPMCHRTW